MPLLVFVKIALLCEPEIAVGAEETLWTFLMNTTPMCKRMLPSSKSFATDITFDWLQSGMFSLVTVEGAFRCKAAWTKRAAVYASLLMEQEVSFKTAFAGIDLRAMTAFEGSFTSVILFLMGPDSVMVTISLWTIAALKPSLVVIGTFTKHVFRLIRREFCYKILYSGMRWYESLVRLFMRLTVLHSRKPFRTKPARVSMDLMLMLTERCF